MSTFTLINTAPCKSHGPMQKSEKTCSPLLALIWLFSHHHPYCNHEREGPKNVTNSLVLSIVIINVIKLSQCTLNLNFILDCDVFTEEE
ncbi:hypothetical protein CONCODRAFT_12015 [Conidiobolus coronatus NRRL 28638]|uniref:Uncharacterized protein n=1 Tax=Conidiobolus coronatus (strain ATCC 28846 / CBS 209.66 / NRRL 28638) TaxID=796925 RepID=A0A137NTT1_CONC2|nr:hypothetical protein CONCODRAFT_12015 [Conidiobolus coronatus NRRL 28638]|eukprot:KXN66187.1 hypothetical protein CONCODRAFT_12015 [Conidiobolus coronatus NRRL 28638]